jgi:hypothetical protein
MLPRLIDKDRNNIPITTSILHDKEYNNIQYMVQIKNNNVKPDKRRTCSEKRVFGTKVY